MLEYTNTFLLLTLAVILILLRPWEHLRWLTLYALMTGIGFLVYNLIPFQNLSEQYAVYVLLRYTYYLLLLGAAAEILRHEFDRRPMWIYVAFAVIVLSMVFLPPYGYFYYVPRVLLYAGIAFSLPLAFREKSFPLIALAIMSIGDLVSDVLKFGLALYDPTGKTVSGSITLVQNIINNLSSPTCSLVLIVGAVWTLLVQFKQNRALNHAKLAVAGGQTPEDVIVPFPGRENEFDFSPDSESDSIDMFLQAAAVASALQSKDFFSLQEVAIYLSATPEYAEQFLNANKVQRIFPVKGGSHWIVAKSSIDDILLGK